ncbi:MAG: PDZ domain-containing protein, partial [Gammaproteobacteria bacterium]|nr:PDZ domain-containing protein [Gammaproteobacteria bacterium]
GVVTDPISKEVAEVLQLPEINGVVVTEVIAGSEADKAGMRIDDVIVEVNGREVANTEDLGTKIALLRVGQDFDLTVIRDSEEIQVRGTVQEHQIGNELLPGVYIDEIPSSHPYYGRIRGVVISAVNSRRSALNLQPDDIILEINTTSISRVTDIERIDLDSRPLVLRVLRGTQQFRLILH